MTTNELQRLHQRIDKQNELLTEVRDCVRDAAAQMKQHQALCAERVQHFGKELHALKTAVWGNGREGHDDRIKGLETEVAGLKSQSKKMGVGNGQVSIKAVVAIIAAVSTLVGGLLSTALASLPKVIEVLK